MGYGKYQTLGCRAGGLGPEGLGWALGEPRF